MTCTLDHDEDKAVADTTMARDWVDTTLVSGLQV